MRPLLVICILLLASTVALADTNGEIGPASRSTGNGRVLSPQGRLTSVGNFPTGSALTPDRRRLWVVDSGHGEDDVRIVNVRKGTVQQILSLPGGYGGVAIAPDGRTAYVSGTPSGPFTIQPVKGPGGDVLHVYKVDPATGTATEQEPLALPESSGGTGQIESLPPTTSLYPAGVAISGDGKYVGVALQQADRVAVLDVATQQFTAVQVGRYPTTVAFDHHGHLWAANLYDGTLSEIDPASGAVITTVAGLGGKLGDRNSHPAGMALDPTKDRLYVAVSQRDLLAVVDTAKQRVVKTVSVQRKGQPLGVSPVDVAVDRDNIYVADANEDTVAVIARRARPKRKGLARRRHFVRGYLPRLKALRVIGKLRTAAYPASLETTGPGKLLWVAAKGFGAGPNPAYSFAGGQAAGGVIATPIYGTYVLDQLTGIVGRTGRLRDRRVRAGSAKASAQAIPTNAEAPPAGTPVRPGGPIKHVFLIVRENRTYDQVFGSDPHGDGDPKLELFDDNGVSGPTGGITPNAHALARRFGLLDHFYSDSEVSVDGHLITTGGFANDYVQQATAQNYSRPGKSYDFGIAPVTFGPNFFLFDQAVRQSISFSNYGEEAAGLAPFGNDGRPTYNQVVANSNVAYPGPVQIGCLAATGSAGNLASCFEDSGMIDGTGTLTAGTSRVNIFNAQFATQVAQGAVPAFNYLVVPNDHTNGTTTNAYSPQALIADNDLALGQIVDIISHSSIWPSTAILVEEDDSQDGADHVDAHRQPVFVISPYSKRGAEVPTRYDQYSIMATVERILGLKPLSINDGLATPMYDAFNATPDTGAFQAIQPTHPLTEVNGSRSAMTALSDALPWQDLDLVPQSVSDAILYAAVHGTLDGFSGPGPDASAAEHARAVGALRSIAAGRSARTWLLHHGGDEDDDEGEAPAPSKRISAATSALAAAQARGALEAIGR